MPDAWALAAVATKALMYFGILTSGGLVLIRLIFASEIASVLSAMRRFAVFCALVGIIAAIASFALRGAALTGDASGLIDPDMLGLMWQTPVGTALVFRLAGLVLVLVGLLIGGIGWSLAGIGALISVWSFASIGHISDGDAFWPKLLLMAHLVAVSFWIGILLPLKRLSNDSDRLEAASRLGHRFGQIATAVIPVLIAAGLALGWVLLGSWANLFTTTYGLALIAKLCVVALLLGLGALNKLRLVPRLVSEGAPAAAHLSKSLALEWVVFAMVLFATAVLTTAFALPGAH
ncbi:CopD family protein [Roseovarius sp. CAU 1744]|uniref:copper resistance D family protein n=1 Tax=Roseovarius sp. CAU 1744 TaxID=3140368 RepID=UPI00325BD03B